MTRRKVRSDNLTFVPASQLPFKKEWQAIAEGLPHGATLFVVPARETLLKQTMRNIAATSQARGRRVFSVENVRDTTASTSRISPG